MDVSKFPLINIEELIHGSMFDVLNRLAAALVALKSRAVVVEPVTARTRAVLFALGPVARLPRKTLPGQRELIRISRVHRDRLAQSKQHLLQHIDDRGLNSNRTKCCRSGHQLQIEAQK